MFTSALVYQTMFLVKYILSDLFYSAAQDMLDEEAMGKKATHKVQVIVAARNTLGSRLEEIDRREREVVSRALKDRASLLAEVDNARWKELEKEKADKEAREAREAKEREEKRAQQEREERQREERERAQHVLLRGGALVGFARRSDPNILAAAGTSGDQRYRPVRTALTAVFHNRQARSITQVEPSPLPLIFLLRV